MLTDKEYKSETAVTEEQLHAVKYRCMNCEEGRCCQCDIQEIRQHAFDLGLIEERKLCANCPLESASCGVIITTDKERVKDTKQSVEETEDTHSQPSADLKIKETARGYIGKFAIEENNVELQFFIDDDNGYMKVNTSNDSLIAFVKELVPVSVKKVFQI